MTELAATGTQSASMARSEAFVRAGEQWLLADNPDRAAYDFRMAIAAGGPVDTNPRVPLCRALFQLGSRDEAYALIGELRCEGRTDARVCEMITELLIEQLDLPGALDWATAGVELMLHETGPDGSEHPGLRDLLRLRYRIRNDLRLPEDDYDKMLGTD